MKKEELEDLLHSHKLWLARKGGQCADLRGANLRGADLRGAYLSYANLSCANLRGANLRGADLRCAYLSYANLSCANLRCADLRGADLRGADLRGADLRCAYLSCANLRGANLRCADLRGADLRGADLRGADLRCAYLSCADLSCADLSCANLRGADLRGADLRDADLSDVKFNENTSFFALCCPEKGSFVGFKKVYDKIVELEIPAEARRSSATTRKCRCEFAKVLSITNLDGGEANIETIVHTDYVTTVYNVGEMVYPDKWDDNRWNECSHGIHFFITREEAVNY